MCRLAPWSGSLASGLAPLPGDWAWQGRVPCLLEVGAGVSQDPASPDHLPSPPSFNSGGSGTSPWPGPGVTSTSHPGVTRVSPPASKPLTLASSCPPDPFLSILGASAPSPSRSRAGPRTWKTMTKASRAARTAQKSLEMSYLCSDHGGSR